jgi:hypothetical protein
VTLVKTVPFFPSVVSALALSFTPGSPPLVNSTPARQNSPMDVARRRKQPRYSSTRSCRILLTLRCYAAGAYVSADIALVLAERFAYQVESAPAIIAHHYSEAGLFDPAARYWPAAAEMALSRSAPTEADRYIETGLVLIPPLADGSDRQSLERSEALFIRMRK